jgi:GT2 family glycosyltransferase
MNKVTVIVSTLGREDNVQIIMNSISLQRISLNLIVINASKKRLHLTPIEEKSKITLEVIEKYGCSLAYARDLGVKKSLTGYICFMDDDIELPDNYLKKALFFLDSNPKYDGVGGIYYDDFSNNANFFKYALSRIFRICGSCKSNSIKKNGWADKPLGQYKNIDTDALWLYGCNGVYRKEIFLNNIIETQMFGWSFLEDVVMGYRACKVFGSKFRLLNDLKVYHSGGVSSGSVGPVSIKMRVIYRYIFWREMNKHPSKIDTLSFNWSMFGNLLLMLKQRPSIDTISQVLLSHRFIAKNKNINWSDSNVFIIKKD